MRQIKFRAWDKEFNKMFDWSELLKFAPTLKAFFENEDIVKMQYTGLVDKNGREIYEGDIIEMLGDYSKYIIVFDDCGFCLAVLHGRIVESLFDGVGELTVIGNIYENPELLRGDIE